MLRGKKKSLKSYGGLRRVEICWQVLGVAVVMVGPDGELEQVTVSHG